MAKRELSSTLRNLKFMQRGAAQREEKITVEEEVIIPDDGNFVSTSSINKKCMVIIDGDPHPGAMIGRMSFQSFNPAIDKLNGVEADPDEPETSSGENGSSPNEKARSNSDSNSDLKRKQAAILPETQYPNKSPMNGQGNQPLAPLGAKTSFKKPKREKTEGGDRRPPKSNGKRR